MTKLCLMAALFVLAAQGVAAPVDLIATNRVSEDTTATVAELQDPPHLKGGYVRVSLRYPGLYRITGQELQDAGVDLRSVVTERLALWNEGEQVPIHVSARPGKPFQADDTIEFVGSFPKGTFSTYKVYNTFNIYFLTWTTENPLRYRPVRLPAGEKAVRGASFMENRLRDEDFRFHRTFQPPGVTDEFFWITYRAGQEMKFRLRLDFPGFDPSAGLPVSLRFRVFGLSNVAGLSPGHKFGIRYGDYDLGTFSFDGVRYHDYETTLPAEQIREQQLITLTTPEDRLDKVDLVALDNILVRYPRRLDAEGRSLFRFNSGLLGVDLPASVEVAGLERGTRVFSPETRELFLAHSASATTVGVRMKRDSAQYYAVSADGHYRVDQLELKGANRLADRISSDTELLILYHQDVGKAARAMAEYRTATGLKVAAVDVHDIYDVLSDGFVEDVALKRYIRYAAQRSPALSSLLLFGDATHDYRETDYNEREGKGDGKRYRVLIPIHWIYNPATTWSGGYADDNWYASFTAINSPDLAVGRIPANSDEEGFEYLRKVIEHEILPHKRSRGGLLVSSVEKSFQELVREAASKFEQNQTSVTMLFPEAKEATNEVRKLREAIDAGIEMLYYVGHGGAMVWRVGPTDYKSQKDLFTPKDIAALKNRSYPVIAATSCYTTSFDFDLSQGEAFVLQPGGGAIAVIGAPWKGTVHDGHNFNHRFIEAYFKPETARLGEAMLFAKKSVRTAFRNWIDFQTYTLLGDPCLLTTRYLEENPTASLALRRAVESAAGPDSAFVVRDGAVRFPQWDSRVKEKPALKRLTAADFTPKPYRGRAMLSGGAFQSGAFTVPPEAAELVLTARADPEEDIFPRIRISLRPAGADAESSGEVLHEGFFVSRVLDQVVCRIPETLSGREAVAVVELLNPSKLNDRRLLYIADVVLR